MASWLLRPQGLGMAASERLLDMPQPQVETAEMGCRTGEEQRCCSCR